jgi:uncharacterized protein (TIGR02996 family)
MSDETAFLDAIRANPNDDTTRFVYADWLDDRDDPRGRFVRFHLALRSVAPDHVQRVAGEHELSGLRKACSDEWLTMVEPERAHLFVRSDYGPQCECEWLYRSTWNEASNPTTEFHIEPQDMECDAWKRLCDVVELVAKDGREALSLIDELERDDLAQIVTLPPTIAKLKRVKRLNVTGHLLRIPPEIGEMVNLRGFSTYGSYRLHWYPYEITRCKKLRDSAVSTRALYGNHKNRPPFPRLEPGMLAGRAEPLELPLTCSVPIVRRCSVCDQPFEDRRQFRAWISLRVATDVLPLFVNACSMECIKRLPPPTEGYTKHPHRGGTSRQQQQSAFVS